MKKVLWVGIAVGALGAGAWRSLGADPSPPAAWTVETAFEAEGAFGGAAVGDLDPGRPGQEVAVVASTGEVFVVVHGAGGWRGVLAARLPGEAIQCAAGDLDPDAPGDEIVAVGMLAGGEDAGGKGAVHLLCREGDGWKATKLAEDDALVHGVAIGRFHPDYGPGQIATVGFSRHLRVHARTSEGWAEVLTSKIPEAGKTVLALGDLAVVAGLGKDLIGYRWLPFEEFGGPRTTPSRRLLPQTVTLASLDVSQARLASDGERLLVACDDGGLRLLQGERVSLIHKETQKLRGAVLADLDPTRPGLEAATGGYGKTLTLLHATAGDGPWQATGLSTQPEGFHHVVAGDVDERAAGPEIVAVTLGGRVIVASRRAP